MAYVAPRVDLQTWIGPVQPANRAVAPTQRGWVGKIVDAIFESGERQAQRDIEREIGRLVNCYGGKLTDSLESDIGRRIQTGNWSPNR